MNEHLKNSATDFEVADGLVETSTTWERELVSNFSVYQLVSNNNSEHAPY